MTIRSTILANLADPNRAYIVLLGGMLLVFREFLRPGRVLPGVFGAVFVCAAIYALSRAPWTPAGVVLISAGVALVLLQARRESNVLAGAASLAFAAGSWLLVAGPAAMSLPVALLGIPFTLLSVYLVRGAARARRAKRAAD